MSNGSSFSQKSPTRTAVLWLVGFFFVLTILVVFGTTGRTRSLITNSLTLAVGTIAISLPIGTVLAALLCKTNVPGKPLWRVLICIMMFVPLYLQTAGWDSGFGAQGWFHTLGRQLQRPPLLAGWRGAVWVHGMFAISWVTLIVSIGIQSIPRELEEAASLDGGMWQTLRCIAIPYVIPSLIVAAVWIFVTTAGEITVTDVYQIRTYAEELYIGYARNVPEALSKVAPLQISRWFGVVLTAWLTLGTLAVCVWLWPARSTHSTRNAYEYELRHFRWPIGIAVGLFFAFWCGVPVGNLLYQLGITVSQVGDERIRGWSLVKGAKLLASAPGSFQEELGWTLLISQAAALAAILIGACLAWLALSKRLGAGVTAILIATMMAIPGPSLALSIIALVNQPSNSTLTFLYDRTIFAPWIGILVRCVPIATLVLWVAFQSVSNAELESAKLDGMNSLSRFWNIVLPQRWAAVICVWFVCVAIATGELTVSILLVPPGVTTLAIRIFGLVHYGVEDRLAALCLCSTLLFSAFGIAVLSAFRYWTQSVR